jgi:hypothetical protein
LNVRKKNQNVNVIRHIVDIPSRNAVPVSDATMFAMLTEATALAARLNIGALAAAASGSVAE